MGHKNHLRFRVDCADRHNPAPEPVMDVVFVNAFVGSITNVFKTMLNVDVKIGKPQIERNTVQPAEVSGVIGLSGDVQGAVVLSFPGDTACKAASKFAGTEMTLDHVDFSDAIGELANMVAGNAKKDFTGYDASISLPSVIIGRDHVVAQSRISPCLIIPCSSELGNFNVEITLRAKKKSAATPGQAVGAAS